MATPTPKPFVLRAAHAPAAPRGAQCPSCFTYNLLDYLPATKKKAISSAKWQVECALCGSLYLLVNEGLSQAA